MISENLFENISFRYPFRDYQRRVLEQASILLDDKKLHIVAAPGSGKTVLGLEVMRRLNHKTLVFVPTINLRTQWKDRFFDLFIPEEDESLRAKWDTEFSTDLKHPKTITCSTYQALYQYYREKEEESGNALQILADTYRSFGIGTICLDEAHHLKQEWWKALTEFVKTMNINVISLTATPPLDTSDLEWKRYIDLCGSIDLEISIPEMVAKQCLCPHQDYLYLCEPTQAEQDKVDEERERNYICQKTILKNPLLYQEIKQLPFLIKPSEYTTLLIRHPDYMNHLINYAAYIRDNYHVELEGSMKLTQKAFQKWDYRIRRMLNNTKEQPIEEWFLPLMKDIIEADPANYSEELRSTLSSILTQNHYMRNGKISSHYTSERLNRTLLHSASKLDAIVDIVQLESKSMGPDIRCLILMDHIRREDLNKIGTEESITDLGVSSVFERLRRQEHLGNLETYFEMETEENRLLQRTYRTRIGVLTGSLIILPNDAANQLINECEIKSIKNLGITGYSIVEANTNGSDKITAIVTKYFQKGIIEILIGTAALLGEGWDAPAINTLIIGSTSSMYVKTNQMRGRGLRINPSDKNKVANIWHLMAVAKPIKNSPEFHSIQQRFDSILGLSMDGTRIENGINRLIDTGYLLEDISSWNTHMKEKCLDRASVKNSWNTIPNLYKTLEARNVVVVENRPDFRGRAEWLTHKQLSRISRALLKTLKARKMIHNNVVLKCQKEKNDLLFYLESASEHDSQLFASCMKQIASSLEAPKYMISIGLFSRRYFAVPDVLAVRRELTDVFRKKLGIWTSRVHYVRDNQGAHTLLKEKFRQHTAQKRSVQMIKELI